jgi:hypothetical protein
MYQTVISCIHSQWDSARKALAKMEKYLDDTFVEHSSDLRKWTTYLHAVIEQGTGNTAVANRLYKSDSFQQSSKPLMVSKRPGTAFSDLAVLCRLNLLLMLRDPEQPPTAETESILQELASQNISKHPNPAIRCAMGLITAMINPREAIMRKKGFLQEALSGARSINNGQLLAVSMAAMVVMFFTDIVVGEQARKSRSTARILAKKAADPLWIGVADGLALQGELDTQEQQTLYQEIAANMEILEPQVQKCFLNE